MAKDKSIALGVIGVVVIIALLFLAIVGVVIIASVGLYFWVSAFTVSPPTQTTTPVMTIQCIGAGENMNGTILVSNVGSTTIPANSLRVSTSKGNQNILHGTLKSGQTISITAEEAKTELTTGKTGVISSTAGSAVSFACNSA